MSGSVCPGCHLVAQGSRIVKSGTWATDYRGMQPLASISSLASGGQRSAGWQAQLRVDFVVNKVTQTHRGQTEEQIKQALTDQLRVFGVVPNQKQMAIYAQAISALPQFPPTTGR
ncbi:hypothetical protein Acy02nite_38940 [Actinoplanes cyaneus]|uniref:Uncharacterized protein n=2 Tax=Actinoplanes cyaneus TaxID=52696 RepID=A0A919IM94_9ACTN|nr:hypothetical protein [Actinoplanes cyaneus]GID66013.1 hypothetical protein Acy02nite_38940 [Actinoplanes cyaneus]